MLLSETMKQSPILIKCRQYEPGRARLSDPLSPLVGSFIGNIHLRLAATDCGGRASLCLAGGHASRVDVWFHPGAYHTYFARKAVLGCLPMGGWDPHAFDISSFCCSVRQLPNQETAARLG